MITTKIVSSLEKGFLTDNISEFATLKQISALKGERLSLQLLVTYQNETGERHRDTTFARLQLRGKLKKHTTVRKVDHVAVDYPCYPHYYDDNYLKTTPGLYPDLLQPLTDGNRIPMAHGNLTSLWITVEIPQNLSGDFLLTLTLTNDNGDTVLAKNTLNIHVVDALLPKQELKFTQWFHTDGLASYYDCKVFSAKWWKIVGNFIKTAVKNGINMILTPVFTPPLDTAIGRERLTTQLVDVTVLDDGKYSFSYANLDKWLDVCKACGVEYYEISHLFTQWGASHAPKIMANVDGKKKKIFGWETDATGEQYVTFLRSFISDFLEHMKARGEDEKCFFHISDEPSSAHLEQYKQSRNSIIDLLDGYNVMDALSNYEFYEQGVVSLPIPATNHIKPFLENKVPSLWTYYCCGQAVDVSNRFIAMPSCRNRCIGAQMFKYDIVGFLHWGYNFYNTGLSYGSVDPNLNTSGEYFVPAGDTNSVYPAPNGNVLESLRIAVFHDALQDMRAFNLCSRLIGKDKVVEALESVYGTIEFDKCPKTAETVLSAREKINALIEASLNR